MEGRDIVGQDPLSNTLFQGIGKKHTQGQSHLHSGIEIRTALPTDAPSHLEPLRKNSRKKGKHDPGEDTAVTQSGSFGNPDINRTYISQ